LRIGSPENPIGFKTGMADVTSGLRQVPDFGSLSSGTTWTLYNSILKGETYPQEVRTILAAVQAIDTGLAGSAWRESTIDFNEDIVYLNLVNNSVMSPEDVLNWELNHVDGLSGFELQISTDENFDPPLLEQWIPLIDTTANREVVMGIVLGDIDEFALVQQDIQHYWRIRPIYLDWWRTTVFSSNPGEFILVDPPEPPQALQINVIDGNVSLSWEAVQGNLVYYIVYSSTDEHAPFPSDWQVAGPPTVEISWLDPEPAGEKKFYRVKAVVVD